MMREDNEKTANTVCVIVSFALLMGLIIVMLAVSVVPAAGSLTAGSLAEKPVAVNESVFPDAAFRTYVQTKIDTNHDGYLTQSEIKAVTAIGTYDHTTYQVTDAGISGTGVTSLQGISTFTSLQSLVASSNNITDLDMSGNTSLRYVDMRSNPAFTIGYTASNKGLQMLVSEGNSLWGQTDGINLVQA